MRVDQKDVDQIVGQLGPLTEEGKTHLDAIFHFFQPGDEPRTDFSDQQAHMEGASHVGRLLELFAEMWVWGLWGKFTLEAITEKGDTASVADVALKLSNMIARRASRINIATQYGPVADLYMRLVTEQLGMALNTCNRLTAVDASVHDLVDRVAPTLGMTPEQCYAALKTGDKDVSRALSVQAISDVEKRFHAQGQPLPAGLRSALETMTGHAQPGGINSASGIDDAMIDFLGGHDIDMKELRQVGPGTYELDIPMHATGSMPGEGERIKV